MIDFDKYSYEDLIKIRDQLEKYVVEKRPEALAKLREQMAAFGIAVKDLEEPQEAPKVKRAAAKPKYQNPADINQTWTGKGRTPAWLQPHLDDGKTKEDFLIDKGRLVDQVA